MLATARQLQTGLPGNRSSSETRETFFPRLSRNPVLQAFALSRGLLVVVTAFTAVLLRASPLAMWNQWDSRWYVGIALHGYHWGFGGRSALAFYPLFPSILRALADIGLSPIGAGLLVSNLAFLGALFYLHALLNETSSEEVSRRAIWLIALFPTAFFTVAPYTESLFLLCAVGGIYHAQRGQAPAAGLYLAGAAMTHSTALILVIPLVVLLRNHAMKGVPAPRRKLASEFTQRAWFLRALFPAANKPGAELVARPARSWRIGALPVRHLALLLSPSLLAWLTYALYLHAQHISLSLLFTAQQGWHRSLAFPWVGFVASVKWLAAYAPAHVTWASENVGELIVTVVFLAFTAWAWPRLDPVAKAYCAGFWLLVLSVAQWRDSWYAPFGSMDRFILALFPLAAWAAWRFEPRALRIWLVVSAAGMCALGGIYISGIWVG